MAIKSYSRSSGKVNFRDLTGGLDTRHSPLVVEADSKKKLKASALNNVDFFKDGAVQKRLGKTQQGDAIAVAAVESQTNSSGAGSFGATVDDYFMYKFTAGSSYTLNSAIARLYTGTGSWSAKIVVWSDTAGTPNAQIGASDTQTISATSATDYSFTFSSTVAITSGTTYWIGVYGTDISSTGAAIVVSSTPGTGGAYKAGAAPWQIPATPPYILAYSTSTAIPITGIFDYRRGYAQTREQLITVNGNLYKRNKSGSSFISTWTSLANTLTVGQDNLTSFASFKDYAWATDAGNTPPVIWDGSSTGAMRAGYRLTPPYVSNYTSITISSISGTTITLAANQTASGLYVGKTVYLAGGTLSPQPVTIKSYVTSANPGTGTASYYVTSITVEEQEIQTNHTSVRWNGCTLATGTGGSSAFSTSGTTTTVSVLAVTALKSGGYRASEFSLDIPTAGGPYKLAFSNLAMDASTDGTEFAFDVPERATTFFCTAPFDPGATTSSRTGTAPTLTYYKIPASTTYIQGGLNPVVNSTSAVDIYLYATSTNTLLDEYGFPANYFLAQTDAPRARYMTLFQGYLMAAGEPSFPNRLYAAQVDAPNVWSGAGESYGSFYDLDTNDGDIIKGIASHNTSLYVFKQHGIYYAEFTGVAAAPFTFRRLQTSLGALSGFSVKQLDWGVVFLSERGPAYVSGTQVGLLPGAEDIQNLFEPNDSAAFNLDVMKFSTAGHNATKQQVWWGVASANATNRDQILVYDYANRSFWLNTDSSNYLTEVGDSAGFFSVWSGNYNGEVFQQESGATDDGTNIPFSFQTAWLTFTGGSDVKHLDRIWVRGDVQSSATTLTVDVYKDFSTTSSRTVTFDMTDSRFKAGMQVPLNLQGKAFSVKFTNTTAVALKIDSFQLDFQDRGDRV